MINFDDFIIKWTGKPVDFDGIYPNQCMDLMHEYVYECLGIIDKSVLAKPWASRVFTEFAWANLFDKIDNSPTGVPQRGDIIFWAEALNYDATIKHGYGHVAIFISGDANKFKSFDANFPTGSLPHIQDHTYNHVLGWLRPKTQEPMANVTQKEFDQTRLDRDKNWNLYQAAEETIKNLNAQIADLHQQLTTKDGEISNLKTQLLNETTAKETAQNQANQNGDVNALYVQLKKDYDSDKINWNAEATRNKQRISTLENALKDKKPKSIFDKLAYLFSR